MAVDPAPDTVRGACTSRVIRSVVMNMEGQSGPSLSDERVDEVLGLLGIGERPLVDFRGLHTVYSAWCRSVPFDNLQKLVSLDAGESVLPGMQAGEFFDAWETDGTGGTCWSSNNALHALLSGLGYEAALWSASMFDGAANHGTTIVTISDERWIVDTAIHGDAPAPIIQGQTTTVQHRGYRTTVRHDEKGCLFEHPTPDPGFVIPCRILEPLSYVETVDANENSRSWSPFNTGVMAAINDEHGTWMLKETALARIDESGYSTRTLTATETDEFLVDVVGCSPRIVGQVRAIV